MGQKQSRLLIGSLIVISFCWYCTAWAHTVSVDGDSADWNLIKPGQDNIGHISRDSAAKGEFVWQDAEADQRGQPSNQRADIRTLGITSDDSNLYFIVEMSNIDNDSGDGAPQVQIAIDLDYTEGSGETELGAESECQVADRAAWEYLVITRFGSWAAPVVLSPGPIQEGTGAAAISGNYIEISVPWSVLGEIPTAPLHFTVVSLLSDASDIAQEQTGADILDAVTNYGDPGLTLQTSSESDDGRIDYHFQVWFHLDADTEPASPLVFSEVLYDSTGTDPWHEWFEIFNQSGTDLALDGHKVGDEETIGGPEGMVAFPFGFVIAQDGVAVIANAGSAYQTYYAPSVPDFEINSSNSVPDLISYGSWAIGSIVLDDTSDELLLIDPFETIIDVVTWGSASYPGVSAAEDVSIGHSLERPMPRDDTDDCANDMVDKSDPTPGEVAWLLDQGSDCSEWIECLTDFCVNNVCCDRACDHALCDDYCNSNGVCQVVQCPAPENDCQLETCDLDTGCVAAPDTPCDELVCKDNEKCDDSGNCIGGSDVICPAPSGGCELDTCDATTRCLAATGTACDDSNACTINTSCNASGQCLGEPKDCDDGNVCTDDGCDPGSGCTHSNNTDDCDDNDACSHSDTCSAGSCAGISYECDDGNVCTDNICDGAGGCSYPNNTNSCDDGEACTHSDTCSNGTCTGSAYSCDDGNPCTTDTCLGDGSCSYTNNSEACDDGNPCTHSDTCTSGACVGTAYSCDDSNVCTTDACLGDGSCSNTNNTLACDDGDACTVSDVCQGGVCVSGSARDCDDGNVCTTDGCDASTGCTNVNNSLACDDGNPCTHSDTCSNGTCAGTAYSCDDNNVCTNDSCQGDGSCSNINNSLACDDGNPCTHSDTCTSGACVGTAYSCDDGNVCTTDTCLGDGTCSNTNNNEACDDGNLCTHTDTCAAGICAGTAYSCDDGNVCTTDACLGDGSCSNINNMDSCDDGNACTQSDICSGGVCAGVETDCNDGNICTNDSCDPALGCIFAPNNASCNDQDPCTEPDFCSQGACTGSPKNCDDGNLCTDDDCDGDTGSCQNTFNTLNCDDGNACTTDDVCASGVCNGVAIVCDDQNGCTDDSCDSASGCVFTNNSDSCDDNDACTTDDVCNNGTCAGVPLDADADGHVAQACAGDDCNDSDASIHPGVFESAYGDAMCSDTIDNDCDGQTDAADVGCAQCAQNADCDDNNLCNGTEVCNNGLCQAGSPLACDDSNPCTTDSCDPQQGCSNINNSIACNDNDACTANDTCSQGACVGQSIACDDSNPCTDEICDVNLGCVYTNNTDGCNDGNLCTTNDSCLDGTCQGTAIVCDDLSDQCNTGVCDPQQGQCARVPMPNGTQCDDADACTIDDGCFEGSCSGAALTCNDNNPCTADSCDSNIGCVYTNVDAPCHDNDACTENDSCVDGLCWGTAVNCSAFDDACRVGVCNTDTGLCQAELLEDGASCEDGDPCTISETCQAGKCTGSAKDCSELNDVCNVGICNAKTGECEAQIFENGTSCDDGDECTSGDNCWDGTCRSGVYTCTKKTDSGCGCSAANDNTSANYLVWLFVGLIWLRVSRRRRKNEKES